jgi:transcriptional regulator GlxA family with amidase domain
LVSQDGANVSASNRTLVGPAASFREASAVDVLIVPGGLGVIAAAADDRIVSFVRDRYADPGLLHILSVCSGSYLLARAGILDGKEATVTARLKDDFARRFPDVRFVDRSPVVADGGRIITSGQIFKGIEAAYLLVEMLYGNEVLKKVSERLGL